MRKPKNNTYVRITFKDSPDFTFYALYKNNIFFMKDVDSNSFVVVNENEIRSWSPAHGYHIPNQEITITDINGTYTGVFKNNSFSHPIHYIIQEEHYKKGEPNKLYNLVHKLSCFFKLNLFLNLPIYLR